MKRESLSILLTALNLLISDAHAMELDDDNNSENLVIKTSPLIKIRSNFNSIVQKFQKDEIQFDSNSLMLLAKNFKSIEVNKKNLEDLKNIKGIVLIGSSGAGKTTLLNEIREKDKNASIPRRFITRPVRLNEDNKENIHIDKNSFEEKVKEGAISFSWARTLENDRIEYYGFETTPGILPIYSANNSFLFTDKNSVKSDHLIIAIYAPKKLRKERLSLRSSDLSEKELEVRVEDPYESALTKAHLIVHNYGDFEEKTSKTDLMTFIKYLKKLKSGWGVIKNFNNDKIEYRTRLFDIMTHTVEFSDGNQKIFQYVRRSPGVRVLIQNENKLLINTEWRTEINGWDYRLPGGKFFECSEEYANFVEKYGKQSLTEKGKESAITEVKEECGISLKNENVKYLATSKCGATIEWDLFYYIASFFGNTAISLHTSQEGERVLPLWLSFDDVFNLCLSGKISEDRTSAILMRFILNSKK